VTLNYTPVVQIKTVPTRLVLEYAFAAYRINGGYVKENHYQTKSICNNRTLVDYCVKNWINETQSGSTLIHWLPNEFTVPEITDADRAAADQLDEHFKKYMFNSLAGKLNQFETDVYSAVCGEEIALTKVGLIAYIPELIDRDRVKWQFEKTVKTEYKHSSFQTVEAVEGAMTVLRVYDFTTSDFETVRNVILGFNSNLYCFYDKKKSVALDTEGSVYHIKGRVKTEAKERSTGATMTRLNYVKAKPCQNQ
jgi:hypothetical protein